MKKWWVILIFITLLSRVNYFNNGFTFLDHGDIEAGRAILPINKFGDAITTRFADTGFYRPLVTIFHSLDYHFYGNYAPGYHLTSVLLHLAAVIAAVFFLRLFFEFTGVEPFLGAFVFAIHPINFLAVGSISLRNELSVVLFVLLTLIFYIKWVKGGQPKPAILSLSFFTLALFSKETAIFWIPALIIFWEIRQRNSKWGRLLWMAIPILIYILLRNQAVPEVWHTSSRMMPINYALGTRFFVLGKLLFFLFLPLLSPLSDAVIWQNLISPVPALVILLIVACIIWIFKKGMKNNLSVRIVFLSITLLPAMQIVPTSRFYSPHYGYLVSLGIGLFFILIYKDLLNNRLIFKRVFLVLLILWVGWSGVSTFFAGKRFKNDLTMFLPEVRKDGNYREGSFYLGSYYFKDGKFEQAELYLTKAVEEKPRVIAFVDRGAALINLAGVQTGLWKYNEAELNLQKALDVSPGQKLAISYNLALLSEKQNNWERVIEILEPIVLQYRIKEPYLLLAKAYYQTGSKEEGNRILNLIINR